MKNAFFISIPFVFSVLAFAGCGVHSDAKESISDLSKAPNRPAEDRTVKDSGFNLIDSDTCKSMAEIARRSVLRIVQPSGAIKSLHELVGKDDLQSREKLIEAIKAHPEPPPSVNDINIWEIENCIKNQSQDCFISTTYRTATVVLTGDGTQAATSFHAVKKILSPIVIYGSQTGATPQQTANWINRNVSAPAFLYNYKGELIENPKTLSIQIRGVTADQVRETLKDPNSEDMSVYRDLVILKFSKGIGVGVRIASVRPKIGEKVLLFGYPGQTKEWTAQGKKDSDGHSLYCTEGPVISAEESTKRADWKFGQRSDEEKLLYRSKSFFVAASTYGGMSGGANFNEKGELIGVHSSGPRTPNNPFTANTFIEGDSL
jgi:hypothetical protein